MPEFRAVREYKGCADSAPRIPFSCKKTALDKATSEWRWLSFGMSAPCSLALSTLMVEAVRTCEASVSFYQTTGATFQKTVTHVVWAHDFCSACLLAVYATVIKVASVNVAGQRSRRMKRSFVFCTPVSGLVLRQHNTVVMKNYCFGFLKPVTRPRESNINPATENKRWKGKHSVLCDTPVWERSDFVSCPVRSVTWIKASSDNI
jgi:hypothetical protein